MKTPRQLVLATVLAIGLAPCAPAVAHPAPTARTTVAQVAVAQPTAAKTSAGAVRATTSVNIRAGAGTRHARLGVLAKGRVLPVAGKAKGRWQPVRYKGRTGYISSRYLARTTAPATAAKKAARSRVTSSTPITPRRVTMPSGVGRNATRVAQQVRANHPQITTMGGYRAEYGSDHATGRAVDVMIPDYRRNQALGKQIAEDLRADAKRLGITYIIWDQHIWSVQRSSEGWRKQSNRGSDNANHRNHVHVSVR